MGRLGYAKMKTQRRQARDAVTPYVPLRCKFHSNRPATVWLKVHDRPGVDVCDECHRSELVRLGMVIQLRKERTDETEAATV